MNILCTNKKASFKYSIIKKLEAGLNLQGWEVKSIKQGHAQISESYVSIKNNQAYLINAHLKVLDNTNNSDSVISIFMVLNCLKFLPPSLQCPVAWPVIKKILPPVPSR